MTVPGADILRATRTGAPPGGGAPRRMAPDTRAASERIAAAGRYTGRHGGSMAWLFPLLLASLLGPGRAWGQIPEFPDSLSRQLAIARTERFSSTHTTTFYGDYRLDRPDLVGFARSYLQSSTSLVGAASTRDQVDAVVDLQFQLPSTMRLFVLGEGTLTNDVKNGAQLIDGINNTASTFLGVGGRIIDAHGNRIGAAVGGTYNRQLNVEDAGGAIYGELLARTEVGEYLVDVEGQGRLYNIAPRHNSNAYLAVHVRREFDSGSGTDLQFRYDLINTDLYIKRPDELILQLGGLTYDGLQARQEGRLSTAATFTYAAAEELLFDASLALASNGVDVSEVTEGLPPLPRDPDPYRRNRADLAIAASLGARWTLPRGLLTGRIEYSDAEQRNTVDATRQVVESELRKTRESSAQNDYVTRQLRLAGTGEYRLGRRDTFWASASIGIYRYDTPSPTNYFDKDEQSIQGSLRVAHGFSPFLTLSLSGQVFLTHLVYLFGQNSNDNNWNRVFRFGPGVRYSLGRAFENFFDAEVLANYTQYDFEIDGGATQRGRSFRELRLRDSLRFALTRTLLVAALGDLRISERGSFSWTRFSESLLERNRTEGLEAELQSTGITGLMFAVGGRISRVKSFRIDALRSLEPFSDFTSIGPTTRLELILSERSSVQLSGWWEHRFEESELVGTVPTLVMNVTMKL